MTKLDYTKAPESDPGRVVEVRDSGVWSGNDANPFETEAQRRSRRAAERKTLAARSDVARYKAIIKKYGLSRAIELGVPRKFVEDRIRSQERARRNIERAVAKLRVHTKS